ncbi:MAG: sulfotransferase [Thermoproteota archaeon]|nr:sulfotransferase [Thermoproteota archaeon]
MPQNPENLLKEIWPNFFIVGAARSGTTSLYEYLRRVPEIYMPAVKEPNYFAPNVKPNPVAYRLVDDKKDYLKLFSGVREEKAVGEASPSYLWDIDAPRLIHDTIPSARIIMILRNPIERAFSHYLMCVREGWEKLPFYDALQKDYYQEIKGYGITNLYVELGLYSKAVVRYLSIFGADRVKIFLFEEFVQNPKEAVAEVLQFLDLKSEVPPNVGVVYNPHSSPIDRRQIVRRIIKVMEQSSSKNKTVNRIFKLIPSSLKENARQKILLGKTSATEMPDQALCFLHKIYATDVSALKSILKRSLPWDDFNTR